MTDIYFLMFLKSEGLTSELILFKNITDVIILKQRIVNKTYIPHFKDSHQY